MKLRIETKRLSRSAIVPAGSSPRTIARCLATSLASAGGISLGNRVLELLRRQLDAVGLEDPAELLELEGERRVRRAFAVRERAPGHRSAAALTHHRPELLGEPRLPHPGRADDRDEVRAPIGGDPLPGPADDVELVTPADERAADGTISRQPRLVERDPGGHRLLFPLRLDVRARRVEDRVLGCAVRLLADEDGPDRRRALEPRGGIDDVARDHRLPERRPRIDDHERLAGIDADANLQIEPLVGLVHRRDRVSDGEGRSDRSLRVVAVGDRSAEHADDRVADELLDHAAEGLDLAADGIVVRPQSRLDVLRVLALRQRREPDHVDEDDADDPPLLARRAASCSRGSPHGEAEARDLRVLLPAGGTDDHHPEPTARGRRRRADWRRPACPQRFLNSIRRTADRRCRRSSRSRRRA